MIKKWMPVWLLLIAINVYATNNTFCQRIWGATPPNMFFLGMWTTHTYDSDHEIVANDLLMVMYRSFFVGTLINCWNDRVYICGVKRYLFENHFGYCIDSHLGYRVGLVYGYDERLMPIAGTLKVLPCAEITYDIGWKHVGIELSSTGFIVSASFNIRF